MASLGLVRLRGMLVAVLAASLVGAPLRAQNVPPADAADVASVDGILAALYDVISGPASQERDWDRFRSLFAPEARLIPVARRSDETTPRAVFLTVDDYIARSAPLMTERGFFEREIGRVAERFENIAHVFSTYESRWTQDGEVFQRGINSIQLMWDGRRWWVVNIMWWGVGADAEIPPRYVGRD